MANKKKHTKPVSKTTFNLFFPSSDEGIFPLQKTQKTTNEALLYDMTTSTNEDPDSLVVDEIGVNIRKSQEKLGEKRFAEIVQGVINKDSEFKNYFSYKRELTAYQIRINTPVVPRTSNKSTTLPNMLAPKALDTYPYVHVLENGKLALEYMLGVYGMARIRRVFTAIITKKTPYDQGEICDLLDKFLEEHQEGDIERYRRDKDALSQVIDRISKGLIAGKKYASLLGMKEARDRVLSTYGDDSKEFLLKRIEYWMDMIRKGLELYQSRPSRENFSAAYEDLYPNAQWNKKMIWNIVQKQSKTIKNDLFSIGREPKTMYSLMKEYKWQLPDMFQAHLYKQDILTPLLQTAVFDILRNLDQSSPLVRAWHRLEANRKKQITQQFRSCIGDIPDIKFDGGYVIFLATDFSCPKEAFTQWPNDQRKNRVKAWVEQREHNLIFMERLNVLLYEHNIDKVFLRKGKEELFTSIDGEKVIKPLSDLLDLDEDQQITHITDRLYTKKEEQEKRNLLIEEIATIGEPSPIKRREKNPTQHKRFLDTIILPDPEIDELSPPEYLNAISPCTEEPLEPWNPPEENIFYEDNSYEDQYPYTFADEEYKDIIDEDDEPLEVRKECDEEPEEKLIDNYFLDSGDPLPEQPNHLDEVPPSNEIPEEHEEEDEIPPYFLEAPKEEFVRVMTTVSQIQEQTEEDIAHYFLYGPDDVIVYSDYEERSKGAYWISTSRKEKETEEESPLIPSSSYLIAPNLGFYDEEKKKDIITPTEDTSISPKIQESLRLAVDAMHVNGLSIDFDAQVLLYQGHTIALRDIIVEGEYIINIKLRMAEFDGTFDDVVEGTKRQLENSIVEVSSLESPFLDTPEGDLFFSSMDRIVDELQSEYHGLVFSREQREFSLRKEHLSLSDLIHQGRNYKENLEQRCFSVSLPF